MKKRDNALEDTHTQTDTSSFKETRHTPAISIINTGGFRVPKVLAVKRINSKYCDRKQTYV